MESKNMFNVNEISEIGIKSSELIVGANYIKIDTNDVWEYTGDNILTPDGTNYIFKIDEKTWYLKGERIEWFDENDLKKLIFNDTNTLTWWRKEYERFEKEWKAEKEAKTGSMLKRKRKQQ